MPYGTAPDSDTTRDIGDGIRLPDSTFIAGVTLGEVLKAFEERVGVIISPYDGSDPDMPFIKGEPPKYFLDQNSRRRFYDGLVDIHIIRAGEEICPKQDLTFSLLEDDEISFGKLRC